MPGARAAIAIGLADVRRDPDAAAELVTQARLWTSARCLDVSPGWVRVRLPDYVGWVHTNEVAAPGRPSRRVAVVEEFLNVRVYADPASDAVLDTMYAGTVLPLISSQPSGETQRIAVRLPGGRCGWIARNTGALRPRGQPFPPRGPAAALALAHACQGVPYLWGGTSPLGFDCSGLAQVCYRIAGATIPRDADQQYAAIPYLVERSDLQPGDLIFFAARGTINHVAIALGGERLIHASGSARCVTVNSLDPADADYSPRLAEMYAGARRPMPDLPDPSIVSAPASQEAR